MLRLWQALQDVRYGLWFVPTILVSAAICIAVLFVEFDSTIGPEVLSRWPRLFGAGAEGARSTLQAIAGAMVSVAALTFSITVLVLSTAATQYTPTVIRTFMASRPTQWVLGVFLGIFVYCLVVLRSIRGGDESFIPSLAVAFGLLLALLGVGVLVYFIHHVASSIQASAIVSSVARDTMRAIDATYPLSADSDESDDAAVDSDPYHAPNIVWHPIPAAQTGYLRTVDVGGLSDFARRHGASIRFVNSIGDFLIQGAELAHIDREPDDSLINEFPRFYTVGHYRTVEQDVAVGIRQLVDIALRAGSPAANDTTTVLLCIDYLTAVFVRLGLKNLSSTQQATQQAAQPHRNEHAAVVLPCKNFADFLSEAFSPLCRNAGNNVEIYLRLVGALRSLAKNVSAPQRRKQVGVQLAQVHEEARAMIASPSQFAQITEAFHRATAAAALGCDAKK